MNNSTFPGSYIVQQLSEFLDFIEQDSVSTSGKINAITNEDPIFGYARATGLAQSALCTYAIKARVLRQSLFTLTTDLK